MTEKQKALKEYLEARGSYFSEFELSEIIKICQKAEKDYLFEDEDESVYKIDWKKRWDNELTVDLKFDSDIPF